MCIKKIAAALLLCLSVLGIQAGEKHPSLYRLISKVPKEKVTLIGPQSTQEDYDCLPDRPYGEYSKKWKVIFENLLNSLEDKYGPVNPAQDTLTLIWKFRLFYGGSCIADYHGNRVIVDCLWSDEPRFYDYIDGIWFNDFGEIGGSVSNLGKDCFLNHFFDDDTKALDSFLKIKCRRNFQSTEPAEWINGVRFFIKDSSVEKVTDTCDILDISVSFSEYQWPNFFKWPEEYTNHTADHVHVAPYYRKQTERKNERIRKRYARNQSN